MDWQSSIQQQTPHTPIQRGGLTAWPKGASGLIGDSLGPILHFHDDASEVFYFISGRCRMEVGNREEFFEPGEFVLVPPLVPHNIWNGGDDDLVLFWMVAPNFVNNKWRTEDFAPGAMEGEVIRGRVNGAAELPSDGNIASLARTLGSGQSAQDGTAEARETLVYVLEGNGSVSIDGQESPVHEASLVYVPPSSSYTIATDSGLRYLEFRAPAS